MTDYEGYERGRDEILAMKENADGCCGCAFEHVEPWELPCRKCKETARITGGRNVIWMSMEDIWMT